MASGSFTQTSFLGGEWSPLVQGRTDLPKYKMALNVCFNMQPIEQGALVRRPGTREIAFTRQGAPGRVIPFDFQEDAPYTMEFTSGHLRLFNGTRIVLGADVQTVLSVSTSDPAVVFTSPQDWATGDSVFFLFADADASFENALLRNRVFKITVLDTGSFSIADPVTGAPIDGAAVGWVTTSTQIGRVVDFVTPWTDDTWPTLRSVQSDKTAVLLEGTTPVYRLDVASEPTATEFATFTLGQAGLIDGPYLDPINGAQALPNALTGVITVVLSYTPYVTTTTYSIGDVVTTGGIDYISLQGGNLNNTPASSPTFWAVNNPGSAFGSSGVQATDVGRSIRLLSEPPLWNASLGYIIGDVVTYQNAYYQAQAPSTGVVPDSDTATWLLDTAAATWTWGTILSFIDGNSFTMGLRGPDLLYVNTIRVFRVGAYSDTTGYPTCGTYHQGRLWLAGLKPNRFYSSVSNDIFNFAPTAADGTVADNNAITYELNSKNQNVIYWMEPIAQGILFGTLAGEWVIAASALNDPLTPTSIQAHRVTKYGCANIEPRLTGLAVVMVQKFKRRLLEMISDTFSGKFSAPNLSFTAQHITKPGIAEIAYQEELTPVLWSRMSDGTWAGCTYRRTSAFSTEEPTFSAWHRHALGSGRLVRSICVGPNMNGTLDALTMTTEDAGGKYHVEMLADLFWEGDTLLDVWELDSATTPTGATYIPDATNPTGITFSGLSYLEGTTVAAWVGGLDMGDFTVSGGEITVPLNQYLTQPYIDSIDADTYGALAVNIDTVVTTVPPAPPTVGTIQSFTGPTWSTVEGQAIDWVHNRIFLASAGFAAATNVSAVDLTTGATLLSRTGDTILPLATLLEGTNLFGISQNLYMQSGNGQRFCVINKVAPSTLTLTSSYGVVSNTGTIDDTKFFRANSMVEVALDIEHFLVTAATFDPQVTVYNTGTMAFAGHEQTLDIVGDAPGAQVYGTVCAGIQNPLVASVFTFCNPDVTAGASFNLPLPLYETIISRGAEAYAPATWPASPNTFIKSFLRGTLSPAQVDPTWTTFANLQLGHLLTFDPSDGNVIVGVATLDSVTNQHYIVKLRATDATVLWAAPVPGSALAPGSVPSVLSGGIYAYMTSGGGGNTAFAINTATGDVSSRSVPGVSSTTIQAFNSLTGQLISLGDYDHAVPGSPAPQNSTASAFSATWSLLTLGGFFQGSTVAMTRATIPVVIGSIFTSDAQLVRPGTAQEAATAAGPPLGKTRRVQQFAAQMSVTKGVSFGTDFDHLRAAPFSTTRNGPLLSPLQPYSGVWQDTMGDDYSFDGMLCWRVTRPYPVAMASIGGFIHTQDR